jgi:hypothetical protein
MNKQYIAALMILFGAVAAVNLNYFWLESIIIPDPCYYHEHHPSRLFMLFYDQPYMRNGHPEPSTFNLLCSLFIGALPGYLYYRKIARAEAPVYYRRSR